MAGTERQTAAGKVTMSLDGFVAGPAHAMDWMTGSSHRPGLIEEYAETTGAVLGGRDGFDAYPDVSGICGAWQGPVFVLTHHPEVQRGLIDEIDLHIAPVLLGDGIRLFDNPEATPVRLELLNGTDPSATVNVRYHPVRQKHVPAESGLVWSSGSVLRQPAVPSVTG